MHLHCLCFALAKATGCSRNLATCLSSRTAPDIRWLVLGSGSCYFAGGVATRAVARPLHASNLVPEHVDMRAWRSRTVFKGKRAPRAIPWDSIHVTDIFLLLMHVTNLEPNVFFIQWAWRIVDDVSKTLRITQSALYPPTKRSSLHTPPSFVEISVAVYRLCQV